MSATFPDGFLWGTATASHQVEGGNVNNHYWEWEHAEHSPFADRSGDACDSYHRWREDLDLVAGAGLNAYRFSLEWSRIEPEEGQFSVAELDKPVIAHQSHVLRVPVIAVGTVARRLDTDAVGPVLELPRVVVPVAALDLMGGSGHAHRKPSGKPVTPVPAAGSPVSPSRR